MSYFKKEIKLPQGKYKVGRDIPEGIYLFAGLADYGYIRIEKGTDESAVEIYHLDDENGRMCHLEIARGETMTVDGNMRARYIDTSSSDRTADFSIFEAIEDFENSVKGAIDALKSEEASDGDNEWEDEKEEEYWEETLADTAPAIVSPAQSNSAPKAKRLGCLSALGALLCSSDTSSSSGLGIGASKKKSSGICDGDCSSCPPHYGYRHGRWYYGHGHQHGCQCGGNGGATGKCYRD